MAIYDNVANLFKPKQATAYPPQPYVRVNEDTKLQDETYVYYGTRICGKVTASLPALSAFLPRVFNAEKQRQVADEELQLRHKQDLADKLVETDNEINSVRADINKTEHRIIDLNEAIADLREKLIEAKNLHGEVNKMAKVKMIIGLVILSVLTLYLVVFYSSTFYSAFFKQFDADVTIGAAMFDPQAIPHALSDGFGELIFILCAPIIFMGLGYGLHFFMQQDSWTKYVKTASVLVITFIFDCILAYLIAEKIYNIQIMTKLGQFPDFNVDMAMHDVNVWAVIFCGFIVYIIWGIVFDMTMTAYEDLRSNRKEIMKLEDSIQVKKDSLSQEKQQLEGTRAKLESLENRRKSIETAMSKTVHFDTQIIKTALSDFFTGWMTMMNGLSRPKVEQDEANQIYTTTIQQLFN
ncbi:MAG: hypothetical protein K2G17_04170 [Duncaniella sp.]|nr:hypothetical protein [Duncaniella sp.]MDE6187310.1 hypothetical protein [Duncaniella sp.]